jgi:hypothetical protein
LGILHSLSLETNTVGLWWDKKRKGELEGIGF